MKAVDIFYPGYVKKAITFTIDDGNIPMDEHFISIVSKGGIRGTFNLCSNLCIERLSSCEPQFFVDFYRGYEIANHCKYHPYAFNDSITYQIYPSSMQNNEEPDPTRLFVNDALPGHYNGVTERGPRGYADDETYIRCVDDSQRELEAIFGTGSVRSYVWPYCEQNNKRVVEHIRALGYYGIRKTGCILDKTGFAPPTDWNAWSYNADNRNLLEVMAAYDSYPDDGQLKFFAFGVHSWDFERDGNWSDLETFTEMYGSRPDDFWYATVGEIYDYLRATELLSFTNTEIYNPSDITLYVTLDKEKKQIAPNSKLSIK